MGRLTPYLFRKLVAVYETATSASADATRLREECQRLADDILDGAEHLPHYCDPLFALRAYQHLESASWAWWAYGAYRDPATRERALAQMVAALRATRTLLGDMCRRHGGGWRTVYDQMCHILHRARNDVS